MMWLVYMAVWLRNWIIMLCRRRRVQVVKAPFQEVDKRYGGNKLFQVHWLPCRYHRVKLERDRSHLYGRRRVFWRGDLCLDLLKLGLGCFSWGIRSSP